MYTVPYGSFGRPATPLELYRMWDEQLPEGRSEVDTLPERVKRFGANYYKANVAWSPVGMVSNGKSLFLKESCVSYWWYLKFLWKKFCHPYIYILYIYIPLTYYSTTLNASLISYRKNLHIQRTLMNSRYHQREFLNHVIFVWMLFGSL